MEQLSISDLSILLVEPSLVQRKIIMTQLINAGIHQIEEVDNLADAKQKLSQYAPDLVISSMYFEDGKALELATFVKEHTPTHNTAYMLISSEDKFESLDPIRQAGVVAILPKPFHMPDLIRALKTTVDYIEPEELDLEHYNVSSVRVLVVDDSKLSRKHICRMLHNSGIEEIETAENGIEALELMYKQPFDLVISDYNMPEMDGYELLETIRQNPEWAFIPVLMVTSEESGAKLNAVKQAGVSALLEKPFDISTVRQIFAQLLNE